MLRCSNGSGSPRGPYLSLVRGFSADPVFVARHSRIPSGSTVAADRLLAFRADTSGDDPHHMAA